jgi:hypothetical protein
VSVKIGQLIQVLISKMTAFPRAQITQSVSGPSATAYSPSHSPSSSSGPSVNSDHSHAGAITGGIVVGAIIFITLLVLNLLHLRRRRLRNLSRELLPSALTIIKLPEPAVASQSQRPLQILLNMIRNMGHRGDVKRNGRGETSELAQSDTASGHSQVEDGNGKGHEDLPASTRYVPLQPPSTSLCQAVISEDGPLIQSISRTIIAHLGEAHESESIHIHSPYQPPRLVNDNPHSTQTSQVPVFPVAAIETNDEDMELAAAIANLIRAVRRGGRESFESGNAPPAYGEAL